MSCGTGFVVSNSLTDAQTAACIEFIKYMTSEEIANKIIAFGIGMAPNTNVDYATLMDSVDAPEAKLLVSACQLCTGVRASSPASSFTWSVIPS